MRCVTRPNDTKSAQKLRTSSVPATPDHGERLSYDEGFQVLQPHLLERSSTPKTEKRIFGSHEDKTSCYTNIVDLFLLVQLSNRRGISHQKESEAECQTLGHKEGGSDFNHLLRVLLTARHHSDLLQSVCVVREIDGNLQQISDALHGSSDCLDGFTSRNER